MLDKEVIINLVRELGLKRVKITANNWLNTNCPFAKEKHSKGKDVKPSFGINLVGTYYCFTCHSKGTLKGLLYELNRMDLYNKYDLSRLKFKKRKFKKEKDEWKDANFKVSEYSKSLLKLYPDSEEIAKKYLWGRGVRKYLKENCIGYDKYNESIMFPLFNNEIIYGFVCRNINNNIRYDMDCKKRGNYLYLPKRDTEIKSRSIIVVEGCIDALKVNCSLDYTGLQVGSLLGTSITKKHLTFLKKYDTIYLWLDKDIVGVSTLYELFKSLRGRVKLRKIPYPKNSKGKDPADLSIPTISKCFKSFINLF